MHRPVPSVYPKLTDETRDRASVFPCYVLLCNYLRPVQPSNTCLAVRTTICS